MKDLKAAIEKTGVAMLEGKAALQAKLIEGLGPRGIDLDAEVPLKSASVVEKLKDGPDFIMDLLVQMAGGDVAENVQAKAREVVIAATAAGKKDMTLIALLNAFEQMPELKEFATKLHEVALPGVYGKYYD